MHYSEGWARQPVNNGKRTKNKTVAVLDTSVSVNLLRWWARRYFLNICPRVPELWQTVSKWCQGCVRVKISSTDSFLLCTCRVFPHRWHAIRIKVHSFPGDALCMQGPLWKRDISITFSNVTYDWQLSYFSTCTYGSDQNDCEQTDVIRPPPKYKHSHSVADSSAIKHHSSQVLFTEPIKVLWLFIL